MLTFQFAELPFSVQPTYDHDVILFESYYRFILF